MQPGTDHAGVYILGVLLLLSSPSLPQLLVAGTMLEMARNSHATQLQLTFPFTVPGTDSSRAKSKITGWPEPWTEVPAKKHPPCEGRV